MNASTRTAEEAARSLSRWTIGLRSEHRELELRVAGHHGLLVVEADPLSGTSALLAATFEGVDRPLVVVDARMLSDALDLAMAIATAAISRFAPEAARWWKGTAPFDAEGLRILRTSAVGGLDLEALRVGSGSGADQLRRSLELVASLADDRVLLAIDHLDDLLERLSASDATDLLGVLRAELQRDRSPDQLLVGRTAGRLVSGLRDETHPLYRAGIILRVPRPKPHQFVDDLAAAGSAIPGATVGAAAELTGGSPAFVWRTVDAAARLESGEPRDRALAAWRGIREATEPSTAQQFVLLGSVHRAAPTVVGALASGVRPYTLPLNSKSVNDALNRMRARGQVFSPEEGRWAVSNPLLGAWAHDHFHEWIGRRVRQG